MPLSCITQQIPAIRQGASLGNVDGDAPALDLPVPRGSGSSLFTSTRIHPSSSPISSCELITRLPLPLMTQTVAIRQRACNQNHGSWRGRCTSRGPGRTAPSGRARSRWSSDLGGLASPPPAGLAVGLAARASRPVARRALAVAAGTTAGGAVGCSAAARSEDSRRAPLGPVQAWT